MFTRNSVILIAAVAATSLAVIVANIAGRRVRAAEEWERIYALLPPKDAPPPGPAPPVETQPVIDTFAPNPFAGRVSGKLVPSEEHAKRMQEFKRSDELAEYLRDGAYLLAWAIPVLAAFLVWRRERRRRELELIEKEIALELMKQGGEGDEPPADPRLGVPDGPRDSGDSERLPLRARAPGCLRDLLSDMSAEPGAVRDAGGPDGETVAAKP